MNLADIFWRVYNSSGQFLMPMDKSEINQERFKVIAEDSLAFYNDHRPLENAVHIDVSTPVTYTFSGTESDYGIPSEIIKVTPQRILGINPRRFLSSMEFQGANLGYSSQPREREYVPYVYRKPKLTLPYSGTYEVVAMYDREIIENEDDETGDIYYSIKGIDTSDKYFFRHLQGKFLQTLGRSRRAFTVEEIPLNMDADELVSDGKEMVEEVEENIINFQKSYLGFGG